MKMVLLVLNFVILFGSVSSQTKEFYERVVTHLDCRHCYFVPIDVKSDVYSGKVVVENDALYSYFRSTRSLNKEGYKDFMVMVLQGKQEIVLDEVTLDESKTFLVGKNNERSAFRVVETSQPFEVVSSQGCVQLLRYYFSPSLNDSKARNVNCGDLVRKNAKDLFFRPKYDLMEQNNVILKLFEIEIPAYLDDISGSLKIGHHTLRLH